MVNTTKSNSTSSKDIIESAIKDNEVVVFSKSSCPYCDATKRTLAGLSMNTKVYELDEMASGGNIQRTLLEMTGQRTVPNVWVQGQHLGGNDDTQDAVASGKLQKLLKE